MEALNFKHVIKILDWADAELTRNKGYSSRVPILGEDDDPNTANMTKEMEEAQDIKAYFTNMLKNLSFYVSMQKADKPINTITNNTVQVNDIKPFGGLNALDKEK